MNSNTSIATGVTPRAPRRQWNLALAALHFAQAVGIFVLTGKFAITVTSAFPMSHTR